jgi:acyl-CoA dehydrogenase
MNFSLTEAQATVNGYGAQLAEQFDRDYWLEHCSSKAYPQALWSQIGADGYLGTLVSSHNGGAGLGLTEMALLTEGLAEQGLPLFLLITGCTIAMPAIDGFGTARQKAELLPELCRGTKKVCFAITEAAVGANVYNLAVHARRAGDEFILSGDKHFTSGADVADYVMVVARTLRKQDAASKHHGFTLFLVNLNAAGVTRKPADVNIPMPLQECHLRFDDVVLGLDDVIGEVDMGMQVLAQATNAERIVIAAMAVGLGRYMTNKGANYAKTREVFAGPIGAYQAVQHPLAAAHTQVELARLVTLQAAWQCDTGIASDGAANMAKFAATDAAMAASDATLQTHGGSGFAQSTGVYDIYQVCRLLRSAPVSNERALCFIAEHVLGLPRSY